MSDAELFEDRVIEYRVEGDTKTFYTLGEVTARRQKLDGFAYGPNERAIYCREWGSVEWGWLSGPFKFDTAYKRSHADAHRTAAEAVALMSGATP